MNGVYYIPGLFFTALCHMIVIYYLSEHRYTPKKYRLYGGIFIVYFIGLGFIMYSVQGYAALYPYILASAGLFLFSCAVSRDCFSKKLFLFVTYFYLFTVFDNALKIVIKLLLPDISVLAGHYMAVMLRNTVLLVLLALYERFYAETFRSAAVLRDGSRKWWNLALVALLFYLAQVTLSIENGLNTISSAVLLLLFVIISFIMCVVYGVVFSNVNYMKQEAEAALVRQNAEYLSGRLSALQNAEETHRRIRHDIRHHLETIAEYAKEGDTAEVLAYIREYSGEVLETAVKQYSVNSTINNILSVYAGKAGESGIAFSVRCNAAEKLAVRDIDLIAVLGNLLENALHGCQNSGKKELHINIHIRLQNSRLVVVCDNVCSDELKLSGGLPLGRGIGISSILTVCRKYDGNLDYHIENGICSACAVLNL